MKHKLSSEVSARYRAVIGLRNALSHHCPDIEIDNNGYTAEIGGNLLQLVSFADFEADLTAGDGNELEAKFRAAHSSSALAVNCFAPFRRRITDLILPMGGMFQQLQFEQKCPTGLRGGRAPNLDVLITGTSGVVGIESKLTEYLSKHRAEFSSAYANQIRDERRDQGYFGEMVRLLEAPESYIWLDAAQLIKHSFGLARTFKGQPVSLLYLYWEPANPEISHEFAAHRREIAEFAERVADSTPTFSAMSYPELWAAWSEAAPEWLSGHLDQLAARYIFPI